MNSGLLKFSQNQLRDYSSVFSRSAVETMLQGDYSILEYKIGRYDIGWKKKKNATYLQYVKHIYKVIESSYQNEYVYKNAFLNAWLFKEIGSSQSKIFSEFRVGNAIADLAMFNGISKAFEIKSELDSDKRLKLQIENYKKAFNEVYLVVPESKYAYYKSQDKSIGIITYNKQNKDFDLAREAKTNFNICASTIMHILKTAEYKAIIKSYYGQLPSMTSFTMFDKCFGLLSKIPTEELNTLFVEQMKKRAIHNSFSQRYNKELNQLCLALNLDRNNRDKLIKSLQKPINS